MLLKSLTALLAINIVKIKEKDTTNKEKIILRNIKDNEIPPRIIIEVNNIRILNGNLVKSNKTIPQKKICILHLLQSVKF